MSRFRISKRTRRSLMGLATFLLVLVVVLQGAGLRPVFFLERGFVAVGTAVGRTITYLRTYDEFQSELRTLRERVTLLSTETLETEALRLENEELRSLLAFTRESSGEHRVTPAQVVARALDDTRAQFVINKGSEAGIREGSAVVVEDGILIGRVERVRSQMSLVRLLTDHRSRVASKLLGTQTVGVSEGARGSLLKFGFIPQHAQVLENDLVFTSGLESGIPEDLAIGFITVVSLDDTQPFKTATIEPLVDARLYRTVGVLEPLAEDL